jgi:hypothetical protein
LIESTRIYYFRQDLKEALKKGKETSSETSEYRPESNKPVNPSLEPERPVKLQVDSPQPVELKIEIQVSREASLKGKDQYGLTPHLDRLLCKE